MTSISLVQFEDQDGKQLSEVLQVPSTITLDQLKSLVKTTQDLYLNGMLISVSLEASLTPAQLQNIEEIKKIKLAEDLPSAKPAFYCSSTYSGHQGPVLCVRIGKEIAITTGGDKTVRFWDLLTKTQFKIVEKHNHWVVCVDMNETYVVSGGLDGLINVFDHQGNHIRTLNRHRDGILAVKIDGDRIFSTSRDATCIVWNLDGSIVTVWNHTKAVKSLCVHENMIVIGCTDGRIAVYKNLKYYCDLKGHTTQINSIECHRSFIVTADDNGQIILWKDLQPWKRFQHKREVLSVCFSPNGQTFASGSFDRTVKLWSVETGEKVCEYFHVNFVYKVKVYSDLIISCSKDRTVKMYKISSKKVVSDLVCDSEVYDFDYRDGRLICGTKSNKVSFFN